MKHPGSYLFSSSSPVVRYISLLSGVRLESIASWWRRAGGVTVLYVPVYRTPVIDRDNKNDEHATVDREDGAVPADPVGIERHLFVAFEFLYECLGFGFRSQLV